ncbi:MAG: hypothetical protein B6242_10225 [Anaerolineaceae bacterium 4572_78]|nr:MAG: hypothetical protein B6242_10225 [Anaerolineaceae bacterium 4572_78]
MLKDINVIIFLGGPSDERNISLDSARTFFDSIRKPITEKNIKLILVSPELDFYELSHDWIYSNAIEDFEQHVTKSTEASKFAGASDLKDEICPLLHGRYGEDGQLTRIFEEAGRKAILGSSSTALELTLNKSATICRLSELGYKTVVNMVIRYADWQENRSNVESIIKDTIPMDEQGRFIVKPNDCGSSDGVSLVAMNRLEKAISTATEHSHNILIEEKIEGREFSLIILQDLDGTIVPLLPTEVEITDITQTQTSGIYTRLKKYMPGTGARHITPMRVDDAQIQKIRAEAEHIFEQFGMSDWARFDGFLTADDHVIWSDLNGVPGYGQDSFLFQQASLFGLDHRAVSLLLLQRCAGKLPPSPDTPFPQREKGSKKGVRARFTIAVIGGGKTSERHVSRMSWLNVIQKLHALNKYKIINIFQDEDGAYWIVPNFVALQHTVEEIETIIQDPHHYQRAIKFAEKLRSHKFDGFVQSVSKTNFVPKRIALEELAKMVDFMFITLHGGDGEDGTLQEKLNQLGVSYNGSGVAVSRLCMDKFETSQEIARFNIPRFSGTRQRVLNLHELTLKMKREGLAETELDLLTEWMRRTKTLGWTSMMSTKELQVYKKYAKIISKQVRRFQDELASEAGLVLKPISDGCSSGVIVSQNPERDIPMYLLAVQANLDKVPLFMLYDNVDEDSELFLNMPSKKLKTLLVEQYLGSSESAFKPRYVEMTVGVVGQKGAMMSLLPSETPSYMGGLTVEEKFCKGVGTNLTPPQGLTAECVASIRRRIKVFADRLGLDGYARIDIIYDRTLDHMYLLEVNTLPGLTPATIIYTQAILTPELNLKPSEFLDKIIELGLGLDVALDLTDF